LGAIRELVDEAREQRLWQGLSTRRPPLDPAGAVVARSIAADILHGAFRTKLMEQLDRNLLFRWPGGGRSGVGCHSILQKPGSTAQGHIARKNA
jgi:hypothetical protein